MLGEVSRVAEPGSTVIGHTRFKLTEIGEIPEEWEVRRLDSIATVQRGRFSYRPRNAPHLYGGKYPFVQTGDIGASDGLLRIHTQTLNDEGLSYSRLFPVGTILLTIAANIGDVALSTYEVACPDSIVGIIPQQVESTWLLYVLASRKRYLDRGASESAQKNINLQTLNPLPIAVPPLPEQRKIAAILSSVDEAIQATQAVIEQTRRVKEGLLQELMTKGIGHKRFKQTEIGEIPEEWGAETLESLCDIAHGYAFESNLTTDVETPYHLLTPGNFSVNGGYQPHKRRFYSGRPEEAYILSQGDLLITMTDLTPGCQTLGLPMRVPNFQGYSALHNQRLGRVKILVPDRLDVNFLESYLLSKPYRSVVKNTASGSTVRHTSPSRILSILMPLPPLTEQRAIAGIFASFGVVSITQETTLMQLQSLKAGLLQDLLTGKVRVSV